VTPLRIAHIGAGEWSRSVHGPSLQRLASQSKVSLEVICDMQLERAETFSKFFGYRAASVDIESALRMARPDAIVCTVQPAATAALVNSLIPLGIPLFIEKPPGVSLKEATSLAGAAKAADCFTFVAFNRRHIPSIVRLKHWAAQNTVRHTRVEMLRTNRLEPQFAVETGIHALDAVRYLMGNPVAIKVRSQSHEPSGAQDRWVTMTFGDGSVAEVAMMLNTGLRRESYVLFAEGATGEAALGSAYSSDLSFQGDRMWEREEILMQQSLAGDPLIDGGIIGEYDEFTRLIRAGLPSSCSLEDAAYSMQLAEAVQSGYSGTLSPLFVD